MDFSIHEVLVFVDGCSKTETITNDFDWVNWTVSKKSISASPARHILYKKAQGDLFVGLDDDAHPLSQNFISTIQARFSTNKNIGIIAFQEVRGVFFSDEEALQQSKTLESYYTNDFIGCGFAIKKEVYAATNGFPIWIDIYGEEPALALEVLDLGYQIIYDPRIIVNHRIDIEKRKLQGRNYFRFERQLNNAIRYYLVYYPKPIKKILKTLLHNFKKYAITDIRYFKSFITVVFKVIINLYGILKFRQPVKQETIDKKQRLKGLNY
nr:glycosyltransferase family 2 protein [Algibacter lectus]